MRRVKLLYLISLIIATITLTTTLSTAIDVIESKVQLSFSKSQVYYYLSFKTDEKKIKIILDREIPQIILNNSKIKLSKYAEYGLSVYYIQLPRDEKFSLEITFDIDLLSECRSKGIIALSEIMRTLPYISDDTHYDKDVITTTIISDIPDEIDIVVDGKKYDGKNITIQRKNGTPILLGYLDVFYTDTKETKFSITIPKGNESIALNIASFLKNISEILSSKFELKLPTYLNIIYLPEAQISENIENNIILNKVGNTINDYFSNIERLEDFITLSHEILHSTIKKDIEDDIIEGFIQYLSIESLSEIFNNSNIKEIIYNNYLSQVRYSSFTSDNLSILRYKKYPLIFRYISSIVGELPLVSLFKYISLSEKNISLNTFKDNFRTITGTSFDSFLPLFDGMTTIWNLQATTTDNTVKISSTAPTRITTYLKLKTKTYETNITIEIPKDGYYTVTFDSDLENAVVNPYRSFPEIFYYDNSISNEYPPLLREFLNEIEYILNSEDLKRLEKKIFSSKAKKNLLLYISEKKKIFGRGEIKAKAENIIRYNNQIIIELILSSPAYYKQGFMIIKFGKSYYISDFSIIM